MMRLPVLVFAALAASCGGVSSPQSVLLGADSGSDFGLADHGTRAASNSRVATVDERGAVLGVSAARRLMRRQQGSLAAEGGGAEAAVLAGATLTRQLSVPHVASHASHHEAATVPTDVPHVTTTSAPLAAPVRPAAAEAHQKAPRRKQEPLPWLRKAINTIQAELTDEEQRDVGRLHELYWGGKISLLEAAHYSSLAKARADEERVGHELDSDPLFSSLPSNGKSNKPADSLGRKSPNTGACNPEATPQEYQACMSKEEEDETFLDGIPKCGKACEANCCCFFATIIKWLVIGGFAARFMITSLLIRGSLQMSRWMNQVTDATPKPKGDIPADPEEENKYSQNVFMDIVLWWAFSTVGCYVIVRLHELFSAIFWKIAGIFFNVEGPGRAIDRAFDDAQGYGEDRPDDPKKAVRYLTKSENDRLGGIQKCLVVQVRSFDRLRWHIAVFFSMGLFYWIWRTPTQAGVTVLGYSGRVIIIARKPLLPINNALVLFLSIGLTFLGALTVSILWLRNMERLVLEGLKSPDPEVRAAAKAQEKGIVGLVHGYVLLIWVAMWLFYLGSLFLSLRPWAGNDRRDYYESTEACCAQYFRAGKRPLIPCAKRRRHGALKIFFGPYPDVSFWRSIAESFEGMFLDCLEPCRELPSESDNGVPMSNGGQIQTDEDQMGFYQKILGFFNWFLGTVGMMCFGFHMLNLTQNFELCPQKKVIHDCINDNDCTLYAQASWFQSYLRENHLVRDLDRVSERALQGGVGMVQMGIWLRMSSAAAAQALVMIAGQACMDRRSDLIDGPLEPEKSVDTLRDFNEASYNGARKAMQVDITWDSVGMECRMCTEATMLNYFSNLENTCEVIEVLMLCITCYISAVLIQMSNQRLLNAPIGDMTFESEPGNDTNIEKVEKGALGLISKIFFHRYSGGKVPMAVRRVEAKLRFALQHGADTTQLMDPWKYDDRAQSWSDYDFCDTLNPRMIIVNRGLLGILEGEQVVHAWTERPRLTTKQKMILVGGIIFFFVMPLMWSVYVKQYRCAAEGVICGGIHLSLFHYFVLKRRIQAGFVLTTRRIFQLSRTPAYRDILGKVEPLLKLDILVHNSSVSYLTAQFEGMVPIYRVIGYKCCGFPVYRAGTVICEGEFLKIFRLFRDAGDTRCIVEALSKCTDMTPVKAFTPHFGAQLREEEERQWMSAPKDPCWPLVLFCCPSTPPPPFSDDDLITRYCMKFNKEEECYGRMLSTRPSTCFDLCCGEVADKGCMFLCCTTGLRFPVSCCQFDESLCDFVITTHRLLVEQRVNMRYCRPLCCCLRPTPTIRVTFLSNNRISAYVFDKTGAAMGLFALRQDLTVKILPEGSRVFPAGLMMHQQPYRIVYGDQEGDELLWLRNISKVLDKLTENCRGGKNDFLGSSSESDKDDWDGWGWWPKGKGKKGKGKGKGKKGKAKGHGDGAGAAGAGGTGATQAAAAGGHAGGGAAHAADGAGGGPGGTTPAPKGQARPRRRGKGKGKGRRRRGKGDAKGAAGAEGEGEDDYDHSEDGEEAEEEAEEEEEEHWWLTDFIENLEEGAEALAAAALGQPPPPLPEDVADEPSDGEEAEGAQGAKGAKGAKSSKGKGGKGTKGAGRGGAAAS